MIATQSPGHAPFNVAGQTDVVPIPIGFAAEDVDEAFRNDIVLCRVLPASAKASHRLAPAPP